jgi:hypothetical protein
MAYLTGRRVSLLWIAGAFSILTLAGIGPYPLGVPVLSDRLSPEDLITVVLGAALGAVLGAFQSFLLRQGRPPSNSFVAYTAAGMALAWLEWSTTSVVLAPILRAYFDAVAPPINYITAGLMAATLAVTQLLAHGPEAPNGARWAAFTAIGWFLAWIFCAPIASGILPENSSPLWWPLAAAAFGLIFSSATALAFFRGVRQPQSLAA